MTSDGPQRDDVRAKVTGQADFCGDLRMPGMLHGFIVRSSHPHARFDFVDVTTAKNGVGVVAVIVAADLVGLEVMFGNIVRDRPILASDVVRFEGEPIAIVVADSLRNARAAAGAVHIGYSGLPVVSSADQALTGSVAIHGGPSEAGGISAISVEPDFGLNICHKHRRLRGDVDDLPDDAIVLEGTYRFPAVYQYALEPHTAIAHHTGDALEVWSSAQHPYSVRRELARIFGLDLAAVRVAVPYIGGGFGSKSWTKIEPLAAAASWRVGAPVRIALEVREAMRTSRRHSASVTVRTAFATSGELLARRVRATFDTGAYTDNGPQVIVTALDAAVAPYHIPAYDLESVAVFTNTPPAGSMRAIGAPQVHWGCELQMDRAAEILGLSPVEIRRRNVVGRDQIVFDGLKPADAELRDTIDLLETHIGDRSDHGGAVEGSVRGTGVSISMTGAGGSSVSVVWIRLHADGSLTLHAGSTELGQGSQVTLRSIASRGLGIPVGRIAMVASDSERSPYDQSTGASRTTTVAGRATLAAVDDLLRQLREIASQLSGEPMETIRFEDGSAHWSGGRADFPALVAHRFGSAAGELVGVGYSGARVATDSPFAHPIFWEISMGMADVSIDTETGEVSVDRYIGISDVGHPIHPLSLRGQEHGAIVMGLGHTLTESLVFEGGLLQNESLAEYRVPTLLDAPRSMIVDHVANADGPGPFGSRGAGEGAVVPVAGAVANAIRAALGAEPTELPLTPETVWRLARQARGDGLRGARPDTP